MILTYEMTDEFEATLKEKFEKLETAFNDWLRTYVRGQILEGFLTSTDPYGRPWRPLQKDTIEARRKRNIGGIFPLIATGETMSSLKVEKEGDSLKVYIGGKAAYHQWGTSRGIPARKILPLKGDEVVIPTKWRKDMEQFVSTFISS